MTETPGQKRRREQHEKAIAMFDTLISGVVPLANLGNNGGTGLNDPMTHAVRHAAIAIGTVLKQMRADAVEEYDKAKDWP